MPSMRAVLETRQKHQQRLETSRAAAAQLISEYAELRPATSHPGVEQLVASTRYATGWPRSPGR
jgi:hypothetical protein